jgi:hypothetical protein
MTPEPISDGPIPVAGHVLVDQRGARAAVAHAGHRLTGTGSSGRGQRVAGVPKIVKVQAEFTISSHHVTSRLTSTAPFGNAHHGPCRPLQRQDHGSQPLSPWAVPGPSEADQRHPRVTTPTPLWPGLPELIHDTGRVMPAPGELAL